MNPRLNRARAEQKDDSALTLTELLVVIATVAMLAMLVLPALAGVQNKSGRMQCANNLRQIGVASMLYANENSTWLPLCWLDPTSPNGSHGLNVLNQMVYTRYVWISSPTSPSPPYQVQTNASPAAYFQNLGYLYHVGLAGNGNIFYCPAQWSSGYLGADSYSPLLTTDSTGIVRSSYDYNPRAVVVGSSYIRQYQKTSQLEPRKLFAVDDFSSGLNPNTFAHFRERGWNVLFTDGGVQFSRSTLAYGWINVDLSGGVGGIYYPQANQIIGYLETDH
jgi:type II secretory pathway pseudopilin PulG